MTTEAPRISATEAKARLDAGEKLLFLDSRNPQAWSESDVKLPGALRVPSDDAERILSAIPRETPLVAYCT